MFNKYDVEVGRRAEQLFNDRMNEQGDADWGDCVVDATLDLSMDVGFFDEDEGEFEGDPFVDDPDDYEDSWQFGTVI